MDKQPNPLPAKPAPPSVKDRFRELILASLKTQYISQSCQDQIETGNHYQSVKLGDLRTQGYRTDRAEFLDQINFKGAKVLDLGSNLGELSRAARERGACLVDGFEYDPFFIETAQMINAYNGVTRVSFYQRDITDSSLYREHYDIVMVFSVWIYAQAVLQQLAEITDEILILETHRLDGNLDQTYLGPLRRHFPYHRMLGTTEWLTSDPSVRRAVIVFAKTEAALDLRLSDRAGAGTPSAATTVEIDVPRSVRWCDRFFGNFPSPSPDALFSVVRGMHLDVEKLSRCDDLAKSALSGWMYWLLYLRGYLQYVDTGRIDAGNVYFDYLTKYFGPQGHDPGLQGVLADPRAAAERVKQRFLDFDAMRRATTADSANRIEPVKLIARTPPSDDAKEVFLTGSDKPLRVSIDGYHRLFLARLLGVNSMPAVLQGVFGFPAGSTVAVVSKGDEALLRIDGCRAWHFPQNTEGQYAGHHPADSAEAIAHLEALRDKGAEYLLFPSTSFWWLDSYPEFREHLGAHYHRVFSDAHSIVFDLNRQP